VTSFVPLNVGEPSVIGRSVFSLMSSAISLTGHGLLQIVCQFVKVCVMQMPIGESYKGTN